MSLPDLIKDINMAGVMVCSASEHVALDLHANEKSSAMWKDKEDCERSQLFESASDNSPSSDEKQRHSIVSAVESCDSTDEGEVRWDALGRMSSIRRSSRFNRPHVITVNLKRGTDGFGLELEGRTPPIIAATLGSASRCGLKHGDKLVEVNGTSVVELGHQEAGRLIAEGPDTATLLVHTVKPPPTPSGKQIYSGWLMKRGGSGVTPRNWRRRWFVVRDDCIAYYYSSPEDRTPRGAIVLRSYTISRAGPDVKRPFSFKAMKGGARTYYFSTDSEQEMNKWAQVFTEAATLEGRESVHFSGSAHNISLSALSIKDPDCHGFVYKQGHSIPSWKRRYCVLKDCQLFYYGKMSNQTAYGVLNLRGYDITKGRSKEKKYCFHAAPPRRDGRAYSFYTESETERDKWVDAMTRGARSRK